MKKLFAFLLFLALLAPICGHSSTFITPKQKFWTTTNTPLAGGTLTFYKPGTTTLKNVYSDKACTIAVANPYTLDAYGMAPPLYMKGQYKVTLKNSAGVVQPGWPVDNVEGLGAQVQISASEIDEAITAGAKSIELSGDITLAANWDLSAYTGRFATNGHQISGAFTFTAPADFVGSDNCFGSTLTFIPSQYMTGPLRPVWWGADLTGTTDSTFALQAAFTAAGTAGYDGTGSNQYPTESYGIPVDLGEGVYKVSGKLYITGMGQNIYGSSSAGAHIWYTGGTLLTTDYIVNVGVSPSASATRTRPFRMANITIRGDSSSAYGAANPGGLWMNDVHGWTLEGINLQYLQRGFYFYDCWTGKFSNSYVFQNNSASLFYNACNAIKMDTVIFSDHGGVSTGQAASISSQFQIRNSEDVTLINCDFSGGEANTLTANIVLTNTVRSVNITGCYFERNANVYQVYALDNNALSTSGQNTGTEGLNFWGNHIRSASVYSLRSATYQWTAGTGSEYYMELAGGGDPLIKQPVSLLEDGSTMPYGTVGSLAAGEWGYSGGYIYVRLSDSADPDGKAADFVEMTHGDCYGLYARIQAASAGQCYHRGWNVWGNEAYLAPDKYLVNLHPINTQIMKESFVHSNAVVNGLGDIAPIAYDGLNELVVGKIIKKIGGTVSNTKYALEFVDTSGNILANVGGSYNAACSTSPVNIALISDMAFVRVSGVKSDDTSKKFSETITCISGVAACSTPANVVETGTPAARTYAMSNSALTLDMASDTYKVVTVVDAIKPTSIP